MESFFVGPRREMITPWSTNAVEITQNMGISGVLRIEEFTRVEDEKAAFDPMLQAFYKGLNQDTFTINRKPDPIVYIEDIRAYNKQEGLALNEDEISYLEKEVLKLSKQTFDQMTVRYTPAKEFIFTTTYKGSYWWEGDTRTELTIDQDVQIVKLKCNCATFQRGERNISDPCAHILALYIASFKLLKLQNLEYNKEYKINDIMEMLL